MKPANANSLVRALADPTRHAIFAELTRHGEQTVNARTATQASRSLRTRNTSPYSTRQAVSSTLTLAGGGTQLRMEQSCFSADQQTVYKGASYGWQNS